MEEGKKICDVIIRGLKYDLWDIPGKEHELGKMNCCSPTLWVKKDKDLLHKQEQFLMKDIFHPKLHTKKLKGFPDIHVYSFRITRAYRGIFRLRFQGSVSAAGNGRIGLLAGSGKRKFRA